MGSWCISLESPCDMGFALNVGIDGTIYVYGNGICAYSGNGQLIWTSPSYFGIYTQPAIPQDGSTLFVLFNFNNQISCYAFDSQTGNQIFSQSVGGYELQEMYSATVTVGPSGLVYVLNNYNSEVYALDAINGDLKWSYQNDHCVLPRGNGLNLSVVGKDGTIFFGSGGVCAIDGVAGVLKWYSPETSIPRAITSDGILVTDQYDAVESILILNGSTGALLWSFNNCYVGEGMAIAPDGTLLVRCNCQGGYNMATLRGSTSIPWVAVSLD